MVPAVSSSTPFVPKPSSHGLDQLLQKVKTVALIRLALLATSLVATGVSLILAFTTTLPLALLAAAVAATALAAYFLIKEVRPCIILSFDGGGIRGLIVAQLLEMIEERIGGRVAEAADMLAGTSTGGIIALSLAKPGPDGKPQYRAQDLRVLYETQGKTIFHRAGIGVFGPRYYADGLTQVLDQNLGQTDLAEAILPVFVPSFDMVAQKGIAFSDCTPDVKMRDAALATSAAPTYFPSHQVGSYNCVDGGMRANNPSAEAFLAAKRDPRFEGCTFFVLSIGTGEVAPTPISASTSQRWGVENWVMPLINIPFEVQAQEAHEVLDTAAQEGECYYERLQVRLENAEEAELDNVEESNIRALITLAKKSFEGWMASGLEERLITPFKEQLERKGSRRAQTEGLPQGS